MARTLHQIEPWVTWGIVTVATVAFIAWLFVPSVFGVRTAMACVATIAYFGYCNE